MTLSKDAAVSNARLPTGRFSFPSTVILPLLSLVLVTAIGASLCIGAYSVALPKIARIVAALAMPWPLPDNPSWTDVEQVVIQIARLPRILVAALAGAGLGLAGASLQGMMRNPLVGPDLVGVTSGACCGGVLAMLFDWPPIAIVAAAFVGGVLALTITATLAQLVKTGGALAIVMAGVFVGAFFSALVGMIQYFADSETQLPGMVYWLLGSFVDADQEKVLTIAVPTLLAGAVLMGLRWRFNLLSLGEMDARSLGVNFWKLRWLIIGLVSLIVAAQVSVSGGIPWIGLLIPHLARMLVGPDHRKLLPAAALLGGILMLGIDDVARSISVRELPVGLLTAIIGTPVICFLFWKTQTKGWTND